MALLRQGQYVPVINNLFDSTFVKLDPALVDFQRPFAAVTYMRLEFVGWIRIFLGFVLDVPKL